MNEDIVKIGRVSSIDYKTGMIQVLYEDISDEDDVSDYLTYMTFNSEYAPPEIGAYVVVFGIKTVSKISLFEYLKVVYIYYVPPYEVRDKFFSHHQYAKEH